jgi:hypothetical protein
MLPSSVVSNQADVAYNPSPKELATFKAQGFTVAAPRYLGFVNGYAINTKVAPFDDIRVRQALSMAIDRGGGSPALSKISIMKHVGDTFISLENPRHDHYRQHHHG